MTNLLTVPFKKSYFVDVKGPTRRYLEEHTDAHPDAFKADLNEWQLLRGDTVDMTVHINTVDQLIGCALVPVVLCHNDRISDRYHAQLLAILNKLPVDVRPSA